MTTPSHPWLSGALDDVRRDPTTLPRAFAFAARKVGRGPLRPGTDPSGVVHGTVDDAARAALVLALADAARTTGTVDVADELRTLYHQGDTAERRGVLRGLDALTVRLVEPGPEPDVEPGLGPPPPSALTAPLATTGAELAADALRSNDAGLVAAAVGPFGARHLDQHTWRHAVIKLVFLGVSLEAVAGLDARRDAELARMARDLAAERRAAGRAVPGDLDHLLTDETVE
ncbi:EboA domain-containing protein [Myceligenerans cantabricum]